MVILRKGVYRTFIETWPLNFFSKRDINLSLFILEFFLGHFCQDYL